MSSFELHAEAACCIWEALLEHMQEMSKDEEVDDIVRCFSDRGTNEMRHAAIALSVLCCEVYAALPEDEHPACFDWHFVPTFVDALTWGPELPQCVEIPDTSTALALYRAAVARGTHRAP